MSLASALAVAAVAVGTVVAAPSEPPPPAGPARNRAVAALHARAALVLPGTTDARRVAEELARIGSAYLAEGQIPRASELLSEAYALDEANGLILAQVTLCYLRAEDFDSARFYLRLAEERATRAPPEIYGVLGEVYFGLHRLEDAVFAWEEFVRQGGSDPALLARLSLARAELSFSRGQRSASSEHFTVFADAAVDDELLGRVIADLEVSYAAQAELFARGLDGGRQVVVLYAGRAYFSLVSVPDWSGALFDGKLRVSVEPDATRPETIAPVLAHELAHALVRRTAADRAPAWFHEGLAQWCEGRRLPGREVATAVGSRPPASVTVLDRSFAARLDRAQARASYAAALSLVEYLVAVRGTGAIACVLTRLGSDGTTFSGALRAETGMSEDELFEGWKRWAGV